MNIVILHCHFERGGVTQVVENHVRSLRDSDRIDRIVLVSGGRMSGLSAATCDSVERISVPEFDYDSGPQSVDSLESRCDQALQGLQRQLNAVGITEDNSVLHWHNHSLGKNTAAPGVIRRLSQSGWRLLLQIHDFAEDNRPQNYQRLIAACGATSKRDIDQYLYPVGSQIHYSTLTRGDASVLTRLGIPPSQTHCLPNSVVAPSGKLAAQDESLTKVRRALNLPQGSRWCLYPVRGIRRKNVGEFLLLSRWIRSNQYAGLTLNPATPVERRSYERWREIAPEVAPRAVFDAGHDPGVSFIDSMSASDFIVSSSVAEGFGMAFLEPWLIHREVIARRLPTVTDDFEASGVKLPKFYDSIPIPGDQGWIGECAAEIGDAMRGAWADLPAPFRPSLDPQCSADTGQIDFARLTPQRQIEVLRRMTRDSGFESAVKVGSSGLIRNLTLQPDEQLVADNAKVVSEHFSPQRTGSQLLSIYEQLVAAAIDSQTQTPCHAGRGVDLIANARPFYPCRTEVIDV